MEQAWTILTASRLETINALPPNLIYTSASKTAQELVPPMREQGAELIIALTHQREPNDQKLAQNMPPGLVDIVLGGHDHYYAHEIINSTQSCGLDQTSNSSATSRPGGRRMARDGISTSSAEI